MKKVALTVLSIYPKIISPLLHQLLGMKTVCRYSLSCSDYAQQVISQYGIAKGSFLAIRRILSCQPFFAARSKTHPNL